MLRDAAGGDLVDRIRAGSVRAIARGLSYIEAGGAAAEELSERLYSLTGTAHVVGITGSPGSGKSTLVVALATIMRAGGADVGILAIDPSSPFSGGSILGDRIRMADLACEPGVFIRSMATRGAVGGLCAAARDAVDLLDAAGKDIVLVETVGVGQDEVDIMRLAHTTILVSVPGLGDDIQAMKAGIMEIADIHVVNKADQPGAERTAAQIRSALLLDIAPQRWTTPVVMCAAATAQHVDEVVAQTAAHRQHLRGTDEWTMRERRIAEHRVLTMTQQMVTAAIRRPNDASRASIDDAFAKVAARQLSPLRCARALLGGITRAEKDDTCLTLNT